MHCLLNSLKVQSQKVLLIWAEYKKRYGNLNHILNEYKKIISNYRNVNL